MRSRSIAGRKFTLPPEGEQLSLLSESVDMKGRVFEDEDVCGNCKSPYVIWFELHPFDPFGVGALGRCYPCLVKQASMEAKRRRKPVVDLPPLHPDMVL